MSAQVERLQTLLRRVQQNRAKPRTASAGQPAREPVAAAARPAPAQVAPKEAPRRPEPQRPEPAPMPRAEARPEPRLEFREGPTATLPKPAAPEPRPAAPEPRQAPVDPRSRALEMPTLNAPPAAEPSRVFDPPAPQANRPVMQAAGKHPAMTPATFGELLRKSLALRPR